MTNNRRDIAGPTTRKSLKVRVYPASGHPRFDTVEVRCPTPDDIRTSRRNPTVEGLMDDAHIQSYIHDVRFHITHRLTSDAVTWSTFRCYFKRHARLPKNRFLNVKGDVVVMRIAVENLFSVEGMRDSDRTLADFVAEELAIQLRKFQADPKYEIETQFLTMPGTFPAAEAYRAANHT